uniref:Uncharacterized protein n=1 Tax=Thermodesulfobacterium geofontis TaxID=1295609 RepID=A0A7C4JR15_9BACT
MFDDEEDKIKKLEDLISKTNVLINKSANLGVFVQEMQIIFFITEMCLKYKKKPKDIIKLMAEVKEELDYAGDIL